LRGWLAQRESHNGAWSSLLRLNPIIVGSDVRGELRVSTQELFAKLGVPVTDAACLKRVMRDLGWRGPELMRWGEETMPLSDVRSGLNQKMS
jgi:hypothetical protein